MSEEKTEEKQSLIKIEDYVPKGDYEKVSQELKSQKSDVEKLKMQLLDPEYINYLESKKSKPRETKTEDNFNLFGELSAEDIDKLPNSKVLKVAEKVLGPKLVNSIKEEYGKELSAVKQTLNDVLIHMELKEVMSSNPDFNDFAPEVEKILANSNSDLTISQALEMARGRKKSEEAKSTKKEEIKLPQSEKPSYGPPRSTIEGKGYKSEKEASDAALEEVKRKYGITSDVI